MNKIKIKDLVRKNNFGISKKGIEKILSSLEKITQEIIKESVRNAKISGRKIIRPEDIRD